MGFVTLNADAVVVGIEVIGVEVAEFVNVNAVAAAVVVAVAELEVVGFVNVNVARFENSDVVVVGFKNAIAGVIFVEEVEVANIPFCEIISVEYTSLAPVVLFNK